MVKKGGSSEPPLCTGLKTASRQDDDVDEPVLDAVGLFLVRFADIVQIVPVRERCVILHHIYSGKI